MLLQILAAWPAPDFAAVDDALAHDGEDRLGLGEGLAAAAGHEGERRRRRAGDAAGDGRVEGRASVLGRQGMRRAGAAEIDRGAVDE